MTHSKLIRSSLYTGKACELIGLIRFRGWDLVVCLNVDIHGLFLLGWFTDPENNLEDIPSLPHIQGRKIILEAEWRKEMGSPSSYR